MASERSTGKGWLVAGVLLASVVVLAGLAGLLLKGSGSGQAATVGTATTASTPASPGLNLSSIRVKVFYIVPAAWNFGIYDEDFNKVDRIVVSKGDIVTIVVLPEPFVPKELHEEVEDQFIDAVKDLGLNISQEELEKLHEEAEEQLGKELYGVKFILHGFAVEGYEDRVNLIVADGYPKTVTFVADKPGSFDIYCSYYCGWGHQYMRLSDAFVVQP